MTTTIPGGPQLKQVRTQTEITPGPNSKEWADRKNKAVSSAIGTTMPVYAAAAGGGVVVDVDGNSFIDLGSGIAVTSIGNASPAVVEAVKAQVEAFTHTCFMVTPYSSYVEVAELLNRITPGDFEKRSALFKIGRAHV